MKTLFWSKALFVFLSCIYSSQSNALSLSDHTWVTTQAVSEFNECVSNAYTDEDLKILDRSNLMEDLNLLNKWIRFSHYYRPFETLDLYWRSDSSARVANLAVSSFMLESVGGILHYIQDAASPPHVIPVSHDLSDGFENYSVSDPELLALSQKENDCDGLLRSASKGDSPLSLLSETGLETLRLLSEFGIHAKSEENVKVLTASDFWREVPIRSQQVRPFGEYGELANSFGMLELSVDHLVYQVPRSEYDRAKVLYLRLAVDMSKKVLAYARAKTQN